MRGAGEWQWVCEKISAGYTPGGRKDMTYASGLELARILSSLGVWRRKDTIVDVGAGNGRLAMGLYGHGYQGAYIGLEIIKPCVDFCRMAFRGITGFEFVHVDVKNGHYWGKGTLSPERVVYPVRSNYADVVIAESVFSHTGTLEAARHIYGEMVRMCKPSGLIFSTWRFGKRDTSEAATNYDRTEIADLFSGLILEQKMPEQSGAPRQIGILCRK